MANSSSGAPHTHNKASITHVIFDMDGLLLDTEKFYTEVQEIILARYNRTFDWSLKAKMMGKKAIEAARVFVEETGISDSLTAEDFLAEREAMLQNMFPTSELMPGIPAVYPLKRADSVRLWTDRNGQHKISSGCTVLNEYEDTNGTRGIYVENLVMQRGVKTTGTDEESERFHYHGASLLIRHLHSHGIPMCLATGSHRRHFELKTQKHGELFSLMHHVVLGDDPEVKQGKPSPDIFVAASKRFEGGPIDPQNILVFEDAPAGVHAAKNAGMYVVMVPDPRLDSCFHELADQVLKSLKDFNPVDCELPPFENKASQS